MIRVVDISKKFKVYASPADRLREKVFRRSYHHEYAALSNISFEVQPGETLGIIGENGAGKSTLLKILSGVLLPDTGTVEVFGKVTGLLELGTGFNPELTGIQNIAMNGTFLGMTHEEIEAKRDEIIEFAELGEFINEPLKTYSSGMMMRLGFAIAIHADPECFLVDEALSVGDAYFSQKCIRKIQEFKGQGGSIIFVSHDMNAVKVLCDSAFLLKEGRILTYGNPKNVTDTYLGNIFNKGSKTEVMKETQLDEVKDDIFILNKTKTPVYLSNDISILGINTYNRDNYPINSIKYGELCSFSIKFKAKRRIMDLYGGILIRNSKGVDIYGTGTHCKKIKTQLLKNNALEIRFNVFMNLYPDDYSVSFALHENIITHGQFERHLFWQFDSVVIKVIRSDNHEEFSGVSQLPSEIQIINEPCN